MRVVGVRFKKAGKVYYFDPGDIDLTVDQSVIVETARGIEFGEVVLGPCDVAEEEVVAPLKQVMRIATDEDRVQVKQNRAKEKQAFKICEDKIAVHGLPMKLVDVEYTFDRGKIIFYFTAEGRVDFRELVRDLASVFVRGLSSGKSASVTKQRFWRLGPCGRICCCKTFLESFNLYPYAWPKSKTCR